MDHGSSGATALLGMVSVAKFQSALVGVTA